MAEYWNIGRKQPGDERLLVLGTQTRLRGYAYGGPGAGPSQSRYSVSPIIPKFLHFNIPVLVIAKHMFIYFVS
jgi:hypothetical protein